MLWIILFALVIDIKYVNANIFEYDQAYHTEQKTWRAASVECGNNGLEFDEKVLKDIDVLLDKEFWIGMAIYRVTTPWIEILGCYAMLDGEKVKKSPSIVLCQNQCKSYKFFGYSESTKLCSCQHSKGIAYNIKNCIEQNRSSYCFVYRVFNGDVAGNDNGKCTTLYCKDGRNGLTAANCDDSSDTTRASRCNDRHIPFWGISYSESKQLCLDRQQLLLSPETYCQIQGNENEAHPSWTNVFKADTEVKLTQGEADTREPIDCLAGSLTGMNEKRVLNITRRVCSHKLGFLCRIGEVSVTTTTIKIENDRSASFDIDKSKITCHFRSCGIFKAANMDKQGVQFSTEFYDHSEVKTSVTPTSNESYGLASITSNNTYAVVNKIKKNGLQTTEDTFTETSYGEYDRLNGVSKRRTDSKENLYDSHAGICSENDPTYDSSNHGGRTLQLDNDVYDHTDTLSTDGSDYGYSSTNKSEVRNENDVYDKAV
ncbi:uncharacterized protein [Mytilus edulis]|uniref:uncharacterized protein n=1 Tax=Mytilus edulis TaxID=6550 RepID=UPI0039EEF762